jgi:hypothetical protein
MMIDWPRIIRAITNQPEPDHLKDFETFAELEAWYELHDELRLPSPNLCDDYSREARALAEMDGYYLSCELVWDGQLYGQQIFPPGTFHIGNLAIVNKGQDGLTDCYYVDLNWCKLVRLCDFQPGGKW